MPAFVFGLPLHVLVVHAVVVLVPLAVLGTVVVALWPAARRRYGWLVVGVTAAATISVPIAGGSGEALRDRLVPTDLIREHAQLGDQLLVFVAVLLVVSTALVWFTRHDEPAATSRAPKPLVIALAGVTVLSAVVSGVQVARIGDSGARAAWAETHYTAPRADHEG
ncbi:MAG TPA: DUF2231 domain-containing protein [Umezawaea sp.]|nr:DUF2231 domain-containing protein [Umezawaea sp.]